MTGQRFLPISQPIWVPPHPKRQPPVSRMRFCAARACLHSSCPENDGNEVDHGGETCIGFFVARRDASKHLDLAEEVFDQVAPLVLFRVMRGMSGGALAHRNHSLDASASQILA